MVLSSLVVSSSCVVLVVNDFFLRPEVGFVSFDSFSFSGLYLRKSFLKKNSAQNLLGRVSVLRAIFCLVGACERLL